MHRGGSPVSKERAAEERDSRTPSRVTAAAAEACSSLIVADRCSVFKAKLTDLSGFSCQASKSQGVATRNKERPCFTLDNVLTEEECQQILLRMEPLHDKDHWISSGFLPVLSPQSGHASTPFDADSHNANNVGQVFFHLSNCRTRLNYSMVCILYSFTCGDCQAIVVICGHIWPS